MLGAGAWNGKGQECHRAHPGVRGSPTSPPARGMSGVSITGPGKRRERPQTAPGCSGSATGMAEATAGPAMLETAAGNGSRGSLEPPGVPWDTPGSPRPLTAADGGGWSGMSSGRHRALTSCCCCGGHGGESGRLLMTLYISVRSMGGRGYEGAWSAAVGVATSIYLDIISIIIYIYV